MSGDRHPDLISQLETTASLEMLLGQEYLHMLEKLGLVFLRKPAEDREVVFDDCPPVRGERL